MPLEKIQVDRIATLVRPKLPPKEREKLAAELALIVGYFEQIRDINTDGIESQSVLIPADSRLRDENVQPSLFQEQALANGRDSDSEFFRAPKVLG